MSTIPSPSPGLSGAATDVAVNADGDVVAGGSVWYFSVAKMAGADGAVLWQRELGGSGLYGYDSCWAVAFDSAGDVAAVGRLDGPGGKDINPTSLFVTVKLSGLDGTHF